MLYIFLALIFYTGVIIFATIASRSINSNIVTAIANTLSAVVPLVFAFSLFSKKLLETGKLGITAAILTGICIGLFALSFNRSLQDNKIAFVAPIVFGGAIFLSSLLGYIFFKEKLTTMHITGLAVLGLGFLIITYAAYTGK